MQNRPLVTIAIPFRNTERFLADSIVSVINQTYNNWELILIDDGSTDNSREIASGYANKDSRIRVICDGLNKGLPIRLNESLMMAQGEYYARMDDDDIMSVDRIEEQVVFLINHPSINIVGSSAMIIDDCNRIIRSADMSGIKGVFIHPSVMGRTKWFQNYYYDPSFRRSQDVELWYRSNVMTCSYNIEKPLLFYREFGIQTLSKNIESHKSLRRIYRNFKKYHKSIVWCSKGIVYTYIQDFAYILFSKIGKMDYLMSKRRRVPLPEDLCLREADIKKSIVK